MSTISTILIISMSLLIIVIFVSCFWYNIKYRFYKNENDNLKREIQNKDEKIYELSKYVEFLDRIVKKKDSVDLGESSEVTKIKKFENTYNLDDILSEISRYGIKYLSPDKLEFLKKFKK